MLFMVAMAFAASALSAAEGGKPFMTVYSSKEIEGHTQFWAIEQDDRGVMYIGDGYGVQEFDGSRWRAIIAPNHSFARALSKDANGRIYVGSSSMLGYLEADERGRMQYRSLMEFIQPEDRQFNYVWSVQATEEGIYFQTQERLFRFRPATTGDGVEDWRVEVWRPQHLFGYTFWIDQTLYVQQFSVGLMKMVNDSLILLPGGDQFADDRIHVMLPLPGQPGQYLIGTFNRGLFLWDGHIFRRFSTDVDAALRRGTIYCGIITPDSCLALGTMANGLFIIDRYGRTTQRYAQDSGLLSNTVSWLFVDRQNNLWVAMDGGVAVLEYDSPLSEFSVPGGTGPSDFRRHKGILYITANDGVYYLDDADGRFKPVAGSVGNPQSFYFLTTNKELFATVNQGLYRIQGKTAVLDLANRTLSRPVLALCKVSKGENIFVAGTTDGLWLLRYHARNPGRFSRLGPVAGTNEYMRTLIESEPGVVWVGTMDEGVIRLTFRAAKMMQPAVEKFGIEYGLPVGGITPFQIDGRLVFSTKQGVFRFDDEKNKFSPDPFFDGVELGRNPDEGILVADADGNIWINLGKESAVYKKWPNGEYRLEKDRLARIADEVINMIYPDDQGTVWFGTANSVIRFAPGRHQAEQTDFPALIRRVALAGDSVVFYGAARPGTVLNDPAGRRFSFSQNALRFDFSASSYLNPRANVFRTKLQGFDSDWSAWSADTRRDYTNLPAGKYRFRVQARNIFQRLSREGVYAFTIESPWYATWWAYLFYLSMAAGLIFALVRVRTRALQERSKALEKTVQERTAEIQAQKDNVEQLSIIGRDITDNLSIKGIIDTVYKNVNTLMDASVFGIGLHQADKDMLVFPATKEKGETLPEFSVPLSDEDRLAVWCFKNRRDVMINNYAVDYVRYIKQLKPAVAGDNPESILYVPLQHKDKTIGVITSQSFKKNAYTDYHLNMLRNLATYSAIALENADAYRQVRELLEDLKTTQEKLVTQSKLAALGALTAGIAHEIKNPLNFVNNFAVLSQDLVDDLGQEIDQVKEKLTPEETENIQELLDTIKQNTGKINEHGKRADSIVRSMLQHSRGKAGEKQSTDINAMLEEDIALAYHGMRAQDSSFNIKIETDLDRNIGKLEVVPQDISRVFLNIISNGFYEAHKRKQTAGDGFEPLMRVTSQRLKDVVEIRIRDNGNGIPDEVREKLFTPFFTTKPAGQGTGLGLSISYDIITHEHHGELNFDSEEGAYAEFIIRLPYTC
ncbi:GAF domain-containing protein [candidate division KSB1 bacterium]|nr:GAF domain-containing protein [candidate division KSB1 bacterium]